MALRQRKGKTEATKDEFEHQAGAGQSKEEMVRQFQHTMREAMESVVRSEASENASKAEIDKLVEQKLEQLFTPKKVLPGLTHETKAAKDALTKDPYNLELIMQLGEEYIKENKYSQAANVLIRGWKRTAEIKSPETRFLFLFHLINASFECEMFKQAHAVLMDIEEPEDTWSEAAEFKMRYWIIATRVYSLNGSLQKALKVFNDGLKNCEDFKAACHLWGGTFTSLRKVGAYDAAKSAVELLAQDEEEKKQLAAVESMSELCAGINDAAKKPVVPQKVVMGAVCVLFCLIMYLLYLLESRSLKSLKQAK